VVLPRHWGRRSPDAARLRQERRLREQQSRKAVPSLGEASTSTACRCSFCWIVFSEGTDGATTASRRRAYFSIGLIRGRLPRTRLVRRKRRTIPFADAVLRGAFDDNSFALVDAIM
jgi:hypothetical protein